MAGWFLYSFKEMLQLLLMLVGVALLIAMMRLSAIIAASEEPTLNEALDAGFTIMPTGGSL